MSPVDGGGAFGSPGFDHEPILMRIVTPDTGELRHDSATVYAGEVKDQVHRIE